MATVLRTPSLLVAPSALKAKSCEKPWKPWNLSIKQRLTWPSQLKASRLRLVRPFASHGEKVETEVVGDTETQQKEESSGSESDSESESESESDKDVAVDTKERVASVVMASLESYKEALTNGDESTVAEIEALLLSVEIEKTSAAGKIDVLSQELSTEKDRILRISADFDNFRKRTERERLSLMTNVQGEVIESLLPVLDNFERAKTQIKVEAEGEERINNSYQNIYKQFVEILTSLGVEAVETVGNAFDPLIHEAIMREESTLFEEGIIIQEFRKGFKLGERLLRPSMVKVSAGPGPAKSGDEGKPTAENGEGTSQGSDEESNHA